MANSPLRGNHGGIIIAFAKGKIHLCVVIVEPVNVLDGSDLSPSCAIRFILWERALDAHRTGG